MNRRKQLMDIEGSGDGGLYGLRRSDGSWSSWLYRGRSSAQQALDAGAAKQGYSLVPLMIAQEAPQGPQEGGEKPLGVGEPQFSRGGLTIRSAAGAILDVLEDGGASPVIDLLEAIFTQGLTWDQQARVLEQLGWRRV